VSILSDYELGWLIGILEGEGHFGIYTSQVIEVNMTDEDTIYKVASVYERILGASVNVLEIQKSQGKDVYCVRVYGERARIIMRLVVTHMSYRRRRIIWQCLNGFKAPKTNSPAKANLMELLGLESIDNHKEKTND